MTISYPALSILDIFAFALVAAVFVASRISFRKRLHFEERSSDSLFHKTIINTIGNKGFISVQQDIFIYPLFFHALYSKLYGIFGWRILAYQALIVDSVISAFFLFLITQFTAIELDWRLAALLACFALNPGFTIQRTGPRIFSFNERIFAEAIYALFLIFIIVAVAREQYSLAFFAWLSAIVLICSSKFGRQALLLCPLLAGLLAQNGIFVLVPLAAFAGALCLYPLKVHRQLLAQLQHLKWYWSHLDKLWAGKRNSWQSFEAHKGWNKGRLKHYLLQRNPLSAGLLLNYVPLAAVFASFFVEVSGEIETIRSFYLAGVLVWLITSFRPFLIIGEAERYLTYHCILGYVVLADLLGRTDGLALPLALAGCAAWFAIQIVKATRVELRQVEKFRLSSIESGRSAAIDFLEQRDPGTTLTIGEKSLAEELAYRTGSIPWFWSAEAINRYKTWTDLFMEYPNPKPSVVEGLRTPYLLVNETVLDEKYAGLRSDLLNDYEPVYGCKLHSVYQLREDRRTGAKESADQRGQNSLLHSSL